MPSFNKLAARKEIGAIRYRLAETGLDGRLRRLIISRHLDNLLDTLPAKFHEILVRCRVTNYNDPNQLITELDTLEQLIPLTYGSITAGTVFKFKDGLAIKRKDGFVFDSVIHPHLHAEYRVIVVNH